jgi:hypothetical protein
LHAAQVTGNGPSADLGLLAVLVFFWSDENKRKLGRGHLNFEFEFPKIILPWFFGISWLELEPA